jgi:hypothetical protein
MFSIISTPFKKKRQKKGWGGEGSDKERSQQAFSF